MRRRDDGPFYVMIRCRKCRAECELEIPTQTELDEAMKPGGRFQCLECDGAGDLLGIFSQPVE